MRTLKHYEIATQLLRSGTSIGSNNREASNGCSRKDFIFRISIAQKEADETIYWLEIINDLEPNISETN